MSDICVNLITKLAVNHKNPLERIWSIEAWSDSLPRVKKANIEQDELLYQRFELVFDAGNLTFDRVIVERFRSEHDIKVVHLTPPPGIKSLSAVWWQDTDSKDNVIFAKRTIIMDQNNFSYSKAEMMFSLLKENLLNLFK